MAHSGRPPCLRDPTVRLVGLPGQLVGRAQATLRRDEDLRDIVLRAIEAEIARRRESGQRVEQLRTCIA
jgi:hypothetical protein